jgi:AmpD protein
MLPELIVVHGITLPPGEFGGPWIDDLFMGRLDPSRHPYFASIVHLRVSAHLLIRRDGSVTQYVPFHLRAWHAGASSFAGRERCNDYSIGIELEGSDDIPYEPAQYATLAEVVVALQQAYPTLSALAGHSDIAPGRKTDPGPSFDWARLEQALLPHRWSAAVAKDWAAEARLVIMST